MRPANRRHRGLGLGVILLLLEMLNVGLEQIQRTTLFTIIGQVLLYLGIINVPWSHWDVCISAETVLINKDYRRFIFSTFEHGDDMHLYFNMISFLIKGRTLERLFGSLNFALLLGFLVILTNSFYIALANYGSGFLNDYSIMESCAIGFSGVVFALKVITTAETAPGTAYIMGQPVQSKYAVWVELLVIHLLVPNASFLGHLAGILAGCVYTSTSIGSLVDYHISNITGRPVFHRHRRSYFSSSHESYAHPGYGYQRRRNGPRFFQGTYTSGQHYD